MSILDYNESDEVVGSGIAISLEAVFGVEPVRRVHFETKLIPKSGRYHPSESLVVSAVAGALESLSGISMINASG